MTFAKRQLFFISLILSLCMFFAPFAEELYAESLFSKLKEKASNFIENTVQKYTSRDYWVDKTASVVTSKIVAKPVKLATAALGIAIGTAVGGPVGATLGAYVGNKVGAHLCDIIGKPIVKGVINEKLDNGGKITVRSIYNVCKSLDMPSLACDTTGAIVGDIIGSAVGGIVGATVVACIGGGTILPIIGTITFATLGSKYGKKLGTWLGKKIGEKFFNKSYKAITGIDRTEDQSADAPILLSTAKDIVSVNKEEVARSTTGEVIGDVIGSVIGTVAGATLSAVTTGGTSSKVADLGEKWGSNLGSKIGKWIGTTFFDKSKEVITNATTIKTGNPTTTVGVSTEIAVSSSQVANPTTNNLISTSNSKIHYDDPDVEACYEAYLIAYDRYSKALSDNNCSNEYKQRKQKEYNAAYEMYKKVLDGQVSRK